MPAARAPSGLALNLAFQIAFVQEDAHFLLEYNKMGIDVNHSQIFNASCIREDRFWLKFSVKRSKELNSAGVSKIREHKMHKP
jgi:hypothetical protein